MSSDRVVLITGGGRGLGRGLAVELAKAGVQVAVTARSEADLAETTELIRRSGGHGLALPADVTDRQAVERVVAEIESRFGPIDVLVNSAGRFQALGHAAEIDPDDWWREVEINLRGPFLCCRSVLPGMIERGRGRIVNLASEAGLQAIETVSAYSVSKAALIRLTEALAVETRPYGIAVLAVHPGTVRTPMSEHVVAAAEVAQRAPGVKAWFEQLFATREDTPMEEALAFLVAVACGRADALSGCFVTVADDLDGLAAQAEAIQRDERLKLRLLA